jgi:hypothetical protein
MSFKGKRVKPLLIIGLLVLLIFGSASAWIFVAWYNFNHRVNNDTSNGPDQLVKQVVVNVGSTTSSTATQSVTSAPVIVWTTSGAYTFTSPTTTVESYTATISYTVTTTSTFDFRSNKDAPLFPQEVTNHLQVDGIQSYLQSYGYGGGSYLQFFGWNQNPSVMRIALPSGYALSLRQGIERWFTVFPEIPFRPTFTVIGVNSTGSEDVTYRLDYTQFPADKTAEAISDGTGEVSIIYHLSDCPICDVDTWYTNMYEHPHWTIIIYMLPVYIFTGAASRSHFMYLVSAHEFGHVLGLGHSMTKAGFISDLLNSDLMASSGISGFGSIYFTNLTKACIDRLFQGYGSTDLYNGIATTNQIQNIAQV